MLAGVASTDLESGTVPSAAQGRVAFAALRHPDYLTYLVSHSMWQMADNIEHVITYWVIYQVFHSPLLAGFAVISHWLPHMFGSVYFGYLADRYDCRKIILVGLSLFTASSFIWGYVFLTNSLTVWHAALLLSVHGLAGAILNPGGQLILHDIVGPKDLQSAVRLSSTGRQLGVFFGPALGGVLLLGLGPAWGMFANMLFYLPLAVWCLTKPYTGHLREEARGPRRQPVSWGQAGGILREVANNHTLVAMIALGGLSSLLVGNAYQAQMPEFAHDLGTDEAGLSYSILLGAQAAGAVIGGLALESTGWLKPNGRNAILCAAVFCVALMGSAATSNYTFALLCLFVVGFFNLAFSSMAQTLAQLLAPPNARGRVVGLFHMATSGLKAGGGFTIGVLGSLLGVHVSLGASAAALLAAALVLLLYSRGQLTSTPTRAT
jgi:MFS family permease